MDISEGRWVLLIASDAGDTDSVSDRAMERLVDAISKEGYEVVRTSTPDDGLSLVKSDPSHSAILLDWDLPEDNQFDERAALKIIRAVRRRNKKIPIFLIADRTLVSELPLEVVKASPRIHPPVWRHAGVHRESRGFRGRALPRAVAAALFPRAEEVQRPGRVLAGMRRATWAAWRS